MHFMEWMKCIHFPDLKPLEKVLDILSRALYANGIQFHSIAELEEAIIEDWDNNNSAVLLGFINGRHIM